MKNNESNTGEIVMYQPDETIRLEVRVEDETVWLNRQQMASLFGRDVKTIGKHINNALKEELANVPTVANFAIVQIFSQVPVPLTNCFFKKKFGSLGNKSRFRVAFCYFKKFNKASGKICISVTAQRPAPISFRLAPMKYTLSSIIRNRS